MENSTLPPSSRGNRMERRDDRDAVLAHRNGTLSIWTHRLLYTQNIENPRYRGFL